MCKKDICKLWKLIMIPKGFGELHENEENKRVFEYMCKCNINQQQTNQNSQQPAAPDQSQVKQQEQDGLLEARRQIQHWQILDQGQKKVREVQKQQKTEKKQEEQKKEEIQQYTIVKKKEEDKNRAVQQHQKRTETRGGLGG